MPDNSTLSDLDFCCENCGCKCGPDVREFNDAILLYKEAVELLRESRGWFKQIFTQGLYPRGSTHGIHPTGYLDYTDRVRRFFMKVDNRTTNQRPQTIELLSRAVDLPHTSEGKIPIRFLNRTEARELLEYIDKLETELSAVLRNWLS